MHLSRRFLIVFSAFLASATLLRSAAAAEAYLIADAQTGYILEEQESRKKLQVGSLMKIATASVVLDWAERRSGDLNQAVTLAPEFAPAYQNRGVGSRLHDEVLLGLPHRRALLSALAENARVLAFYEHRGWRVVLPELRFEPGRPTFAILGRDVPD